MVGATMHALFDLAVRHHRERVALVFEGRRVAYDELGRLVRICANGLGKMGLVRGDRVALLMANCLEYVIVSYAAIRSGLILVPLNTMLSGPEIRARLADSGARAIVFDLAFEELVDQMAPELPELTVRVVRDVRAAGAITPVAALLEGYSDEHAGAPAFEDDVVALMYTGGTTGVSKGVMHTHRSMVAISVGELGVYEIERDAVMLHAAPLPHTTGFTVLAGMLQGATQVIARRFEPDEVLATMHRESVTWMFMVPTMLYMLLEAVARAAKPPALRTLVYGASPSSPERIVEAVERLGPVLIQGYAQMEIAKVGTCLTKEEHRLALIGDRTILRSCGRPVPLCRLRIVDDDDETLAPGTVGEVLLQGPHMMAGYWRREEETQKTMRGGWIHTGDLAYEDERGYVYIVDRKKDMIITGGMNVYSNEVERVLMEHPGVREAVVIGVPDDKWGEAVTGLVVLRDAALSTEELLAFCRPRLSAYQRPKSIATIPDVPKTPYGKPDKKQLRAPYWAGRDRQVHG